MTVDFARMMGNEIYKSIYNNSTCSCGNHLSDFAEAGASAGFVGGNELKTWGELTTAEINQNIQEQCRYCMYRSRKGTCRNGEVGMGNCVKCKRTDIKCCITCAKDSSKCEVWHHCGQDCPEWQSGIMTEADRIRHMTVEELAEFLCKVKADYQWVDQEFPREEECGEWEE